MPPNKRLPDPIHYSPNREKTHPPAPCKAMLTHKSHAPDWSSPQKQTVTLFWNANAHHQPLAPRHAFGLGESLMWVGLALQFSDFTVQEAQWMYETNTDRGGRRGRYKVILGPWIWRTLWGSFNVHLMSWSLNEYAYILSHYTWGNNISRSPSETTVF